MKEIYVKQKWIYIRMVYIDIQLHAGTCQCKTWSCTFFVFQLGFQHFMELHYFNVALKSCGSLISVFIILTLMETNYSRKKETSPNTDLHNFILFFLPLFLFLYLFYLPLQGKELIVCCAFLLSFVRTQTKCETTWNRIANAIVLCQMKK